MKISKKRVGMVGITILMIFTNISILLFSGNNIVTQKMITSFATVASFEIICTFIMWRKIDDTYLSPFFIFYVTSIIYGVGQIFGWTLGFSVGEKDLLTYGIEYKYIYISLIYSVSGLLAFFMGAVLFFGKNIKKMSTTQTDSNRIDFAAIDSVSKIIFFVSLPFLIIYWAKILPSIIMGGYMEYYAETGNFSQLETLASMIADWFPISLLLIYAINIKKKKKLGVIALSILLLYILVLLYIGGRSVAVEILLALLITNQYFGKKFSKKQILLLCAGMFFLICILNAIAQTRGMGNRSLSDTFNGMTFGIVDAIGNFIGEMGWQMSSTAWTMQFIPENGGFKYGLSYLSALTVVIPNLGQWTIHPDKLVNAGDWMQALLNRKTGMGYSFIAETYYNFAWGGLIAMFIIGCLISKWLTAINLKNARYNYRYVIVIIIAFATILRPFVRSTFSASLRKVVYVIFAILLMIYFIKKYLLQNREKGDKNE